MMDRIRWQNQRFDHLAQNSPDARFILFITPLLLSVVADMLLIFLWDFPAFLFISVLMVMAAWRIIGTSVDVNRRT
jgi:hypothetical protein